MKKQNRTTLHSERKENEVEISEILKQAEAVLKDYINPHTNDFDEVLIRLRTVITMAHRTGYIAAIEVHAHE